jgi:hypothetical protein
MTATILQEAEANEKERLPWHQPEVQRLTISLDTNMPKPISDEDLLLQKPG